MENQRSNPRRAQSGPLQIKGMGHQILEAHDFKCRFVCRQQPDAWGYAVFEGLLPPGDTEAPAIARIETRKPELGSRCFQIVSRGRTEIQQRFCDEACPRDRLERYPGLVRIRLKPKLVNRRDRDPALLVHLEGARDSLLIDCGSLDAVPKVELLKLSHLFVTHTHIDHFCGFDRILRHVLGGENRIHVFGPPGITRNVQGKLDGYTWNLIDVGGPTFVVHELDGDQKLTTEFTCRRRFAPSFEAVSSTIESGCIVDDGRLKVHFAALEHQIPSLAYSVEESPFASVRANRLGTDGPRPGPWLTRLQELAIRGWGPDDTLEVAGCIRRVPDLIDEFIEVKPGVKIAYATDTVFNERTLATIAQLANRADVFYCESNYQDPDEDKASSYFHLTARQAGQLARAAQVEKLILFHLSRKYLGDIGTSILQAKEEFDRVE